MEQARARQLEACTVAAAKAAPGVPCASRGTTDWREHQWYPQSCPQHRRSPLPPCPRKFLPLQVSIPARCTACQSVSAGPHSACTFEKASASILSSIEVVNWCVRPEACCSGGTLSRPASAEPQMMMSSTELDVSADRLPAGFLSLSSAEAGLGRLQEAQSSEGELGDRQLEHGFRRIRSSRRTGLRIRLACRSGLAVYELDLQER